MKCSDISTRIRVGLIVRKLASRLTNVTGASVFSAILFGGLLPSIVSTQVEARGFYRAYYKNQEVGDFKEAPTNQNFSKLDPEYQLLTLAEILAMTDPSVPGFAESKKVFQQYFSQAKPEDKADIISDAFQLAVINQDIKLMKDLFAKGAAVNPDLAGRYICEALSTAGGDRPGDDFNDELFASNPEKIANLLPLINQVPRLNERGCEVMMNEELIRIPILNLVEKASPAFRQKLVPTNRSAPVTFTSLALAYSSCSATQLQGYLKFHVLPIFTEMKKGGIQFARFQDQQCVLDGTFKKMIIGQEQSFEFRPSNGRFGYYAQAIPFTTIEELVKILKTGTR